MIPLVQRLVLVVVVAAAACNYRDGIVPTDGAIVLPQVGFAQPTTLTDESAGTVMIAVALSSEPTSPVSGGYRVSGGTATEGSDFTIPDGTLMLTSTTPVTIPVTILPDGVAEPDETIELELQAIVGATPGQRKHTIT